MLRGKKTRQVVVAATGWHFENGEFHYWVGARDKDEAIGFISKLDPAAAKNEPKRIPVSVMRFFGLTQGRYITGRDQTFRKK